MEYFNMNPKFIRYGGRKAPRGTIQQLTDVLDAGLPPVPEYMKEWDDGQYLVSQPQVKIFGKRFCEAPGILDYDGLGKAGRDLSHITNRGIEVAFEELGVAENGVPYLFCSAYEDAGEPFAFFLYCDGKTIRGYLPHYGNMLTVPEFEPFSPMADFSMAKDLVFIQKGNGLVVSVSFDNDEELREYIENSGGDVTFSKEACLKDFSARVEPVGELTDERVAVIRKNVAKTYEKFAKEYM